MANDKTFAESIINAITWDDPALAGMHRMEFTDALGERHEARYAYDPVVSHQSAPKNRLHRWLLQPGTKADITLPGKPGGTLSIRITEYADQQYIPGIYTNHEGKTELRSMVPLRVRYEATKWHPLTQVITGWDRDRQAERSYALNEWDFTAAGIARFTAAQADQFPEHPMDDAYARAVKTAPGDQREACAGNPIIPVGVPL